MLEVATELFYSRGVHEVGMDELIAVAGLGKATVYRLFATKDDLIRAYLERAAARVLAHVDRDLADHPDDPREALRAVLRGVWTHASRDGFRGCAFSNASAEFDDPRHPARTIARRYRAQLRRRLNVPGEQIAPELGDQLAVLIDGIYANAAHLGPTGPAEAAYQLAQSLVEGEGAAT